MGFIEFHSSFFIHYVVLLLCMTRNFPCIAISKIGGNETDRLALLAFKAKVTDDPSQVLSSWNASVHFCQWNGVRCGIRHQRVTELNLDARKLSGTISPYIGNLSFLEVLQLQSNSFSNVIPPEFGRLSRLQHLYLFNNSISSEIPAIISSCSNLIGIDVSDNHLVGKIPSELGALSKLQLLNVSRNHLTGAIPHSFGNMSGLQELDMLYNNFEGGIPYSLGQLTKLKDFRLGENMFSGTIPPSIFNLSSITRFDVINNQIHGILPSDLGITLPNLVTFGIALNKFTGSIPVSLSNASNLYWLMIADNELTGKVPTFEKLHKLRWLAISNNQLGSKDADDLSFLPSLTNATKLDILALGDNNFGGVLPQSICNLSTLSSLCLPGNSIFGHIPHRIGNLVNLVTLSMPENQLIGNIPSNIGKLHKLQILALYENQFSGVIPSSLGNLTLLNELELDGNKLQGNIPESLGKCQNLLSLSLDRNNLSGSIPPQILKLSSLSIFLDLSRNHLTGSLPEEVGNLKNLGKLYVAENMLTGEIPFTIGHCVRLEVLDIEGNFFRGAIPSSLSSLRGIEVLDVSRNNLSGEIPEYLEHFKFLENLNVSFNDFRGQVPLEGIFKNASAISVVGNSKLCGGIPELQLPGCNFKESKNMRRTLTLKLTIIPTILGLLGLTLTLCILLFCSSKKTMKEPCSYSPENLLLTLSYHSLLKATDAFSSINLIGTGGFGSVYKGILDHHGTIVAVKVLNLLHIGASKSFIAECEALRNVRHRNIVKLLTACCGIDYQGNDFKALVYEFMVNGSLEEWLHPNSRESNGQEGRKNLHLLQRLNIAVDVASALDYLHHHCLGLIVHCDLKPSNVLLDNEMTGHVGDFGLARFPIEEINTYQTSSMGIRGSTGYAAPEYGMGSKVSTCGDVYSYGILLLEMFTGKRPTDEMFHDSLNLHNFAKMALPDQVLEISDATLLQEGEEWKKIADTATHYQIDVTNNKIRQCLISIFKIGISCSVQSPRERPDIGDVVAELHVIRNNLLRVVYMNGEVQLQFNQEIA